MIASITRRLLSRLPGRTGGLLLGLALLGCAGSAQAFLSLGMFPGFYFPEKYYRFGAVYTRAIVPGPNGRPVYVEYDTTGKEVRQIGEAIGELERVQVQAADYYRSLLARLDDVRSRYPDSRVFSAAEYRAQTFKTVTGETITKPNLESSSKSAVVRAANQLFDKNGKDLLLLELPIKWDERPFFTSKSLIVSEEGKILHESPNTFGLRVGFFGKDGQVSEGVRRPNDAQIYGPLADVNVTLGGFIPGGIATTDEEGKYRMQYSLPPCPGFFFEYTTPAYLELFYKRFNPRSSSYMPYTLSRANYDFCNGMGIYSIEAAAIVASIATPVKQPADFPIDLMVLDGSANFAQVKMDAQTSYDSESAEHAHYLQQNYDFDGDEKPDHVVPGKKVKKEVNGEQREVFVGTPVEEAELQGIYLSSRYENVPADMEATPPDFTRLMDTAADFNDRGLLKTISKEELRDTDIYVFRESTGQLVAERRGLHEDELYKNYSGVDEQSGAFRYTIQLRGSVENYYNALSDRRGEDGFQKWQSAGGFREEFQKRTANHLKAGEVVRIIAINRPTGYLGSTKVQLQSAVAEGNLLNFPEHQIQMSPPNLKVWAERRNRIEYGTTKGEQNRQLIGNEGAGLGSDISIAIYSDWRDSDGSPLPEELADYGYTGRLAKVVATNQLAPVGANQLSQFTVKPGYQVQVIHLPEKVLGKQHLYLQVVGQPSNRNPDFSSGKGQGILQARPSRYVPVKIPLHDEEASELARQAYRKADKEHPELNLKKPEPLYSWQYRPELQFSLYDLNVESIRRTDYDNKTSQMLHDKAPMFTSSDKLLEFYYDLLKNENSELQPWERQGEREMVLAVGEQEIKATLGADQTIRFDNFDHLGALDVDDYLTMRLYANNDVGNTLWEYAFEYLSLDSVVLGYNNQTDDTWYVTADDPTVDMRAVLLGYADRRPELKPQLTLIWRVEGPGQMASIVQADRETGVFDNRLTMPRTAGSVGVVRARLADSGTEAVFKKVEVLPGEPSSIDISATGTAAAMEADKLQLTITVRDAHGNRVADGTSVDLLATEDVLLSGTTTGTVNGVVTATITGNAFSVPDARVNVKAGQITKDYDFKVEGLTVKLDALPGVLVPEREYSLPVQVLTSSGKPAADVLVTLSSDLGYFKESQYQTDAEGRINAVFLSGTGTGEGTWSIRAGFAGAAKHAFSVVRPGGGADSDVRDAMVLGDVQDGDRVAFERFDGKSIRLDYQTYGNIKVTGAAGTTVQATLGDLSDPNLEPLLAYYMNDVDDPGPDEKYPGRVVSDIPDELGLHTGTGFDVEVARDHPMGRGSSYLFDGRGFIERQADAVLLKPESIGFRVDYKATASGAIVDLGRGMRLVQTQDGLRLELITDAGEFSIERPAVALGAWHRVGARYANGELSLELDGARFNTPASGAVHYSSDKLVLGQAFKGNLNSFRLYDWAALPLLRFAGDTQQQSVTLPASRSVDLRVESTALLGKLQQGSQLSSLRVAVTIDGMRQFVSVLSTQGYLQLAGQYLETYGSLAPALIDPNATTGEDISSLYRVMPWYTGLTLLSYMTEEAYADDGEESSGVWGFLKAAVNFLIPLEDMKILGEQLYYLATGDWENFKPMELIFAALGVVTILPMAKPLKFVLKPLKNFILKFSRNPIVKAVAAVFGRAAEEAMKGRTQKLLSLLPYFLIVVEMVDSPEGPEAIMAMINGIESTDDLWTWIEYFALPTDGWEGEEPPSVAFAPVAGERRDTFSLMEALVPSAHAARGITPRRVAGKIIAKAIKETLEHGEPKDLTKVFKQVVQSLKDPDGARLRPMAHMGELLRSAIAMIKRAGMSNLAALLKGKPDDRVNRKTLIALIAYVEASLVAGELSDNHGMQLEIASLYADATIAKSENKRHGGTFQLLMLAYYQTLHVLAGGPPVYELEGERPIQYYRQGGVKDGAPYRRRVDIVLGSKDEQIWVEVKSLKWPYNASSFKPNSASTGYHKEFYGDLVANNGAELGYKVSDFYWRFHDFKNKVSQGPTKAEFRGFRMDDKLCTSSLVKGRAFATTKRTDAQLRAACLIGNHASLQDEVSVMMEILKSPIFTDAFKKLADI